MLSSSMAATSLPGLSSRVPSIHRVCMDRATVLKYLSPTCVPCVSCLKAMPKTYMMMASRKKTKEQERMEANIALMRIRSSGMTLNSRAIRAIRESLSSLAIRSMLALPRPPPLPPAHRRTIVMTHVSETPMKTRAESNMNHPSRHPERFLANDLNRTNHSRAKYKQKQCSVIWKAGSASRRISALLKSVSMAIHMALMPMMHSVRFSNTGCLAIFCQMPVLRYRLVTWYVGFTAAARIFCFIDSASKNTFPCARPWLFFGPPLWSVLTNDPSDVLVLWIFAW
mmetsp:Transcript_113284/g.320946  ORF Transcript_113284/g.320946 Transcript_113284/m.320946 type:complete len:283 (-) Transcript_113284:44-892(-)